MGHDDNAIDPESDEGKQQEFEEAAIGSEHGDMVLTGYSKGRWQNCDVTQKYAHRSNNPRKLPAKGPPSDPRLPDDADYEGDNVQDRKSVV